MLIGLRPKPLSASIHNIRTPQANLALPFIPAFPPSRTPQHFQTSPKLRPLPSIPMLLPLGRAASRTRCTPKTDRLILGIRAPLLPSLFLQSTEYRVRSTYLFLAAQQGQRTKKINQG